MDPRLLPRARCVPALLQVSAGLEEASLVVELILTLNSFGKLSGVVLSLVVLERVLVLGK